MRVYLGLGRAPRGDLNAIRQFTGCTMSPIYKSFTGQHISERPLRLLLSYHYFKDEDIERLKNVELAGFKDVQLFADSGAFSVWSAGATITVPEYAAWLKRWGHCFTVAAALDVIGDAEASYRQSNELRDIVDTVEIMPVYHATDDGGFAYLRKYVDAGYTYVGVSPTALRTSNPRLMDTWIAKCFDLRPEGVRYHGFGVTGWGRLKKHPWYSVDSTSWVSGFRFASLHLFDYRAGDWVSIEQRDGKSILAASSVLKLYGLQPKDVRADKYDRDQLVRALLESWHAAEDWLTKKHGRQHRIYLGTSDSTSAPNSPKVIGFASKGAKGSK